MRPTDRTSKAKNDEKRYPVRIHVAVPERGFGSLAQDIWVWLDRDCGRDGWASHGGYHTTSPVDSVFIYFSDISLSKKFLEVFELETVEVTTTIRSPDYETLHHLHGIPGGNRTRRS